MVRVHSPETKQRISDSLKQTFKDPDIRAKLSTIMKAKWSDPEIRSKMLAARPTNRKCSLETKLKMSISAKKRLEDPKAREKISQANRNRIITPETRAKLSAKRYSPESKAKISAALTGRPLSEETKTKLSISNKKRIRTQEEINRHADTMKKRWDDPLTRIKMSEQNTGEKNPSWCGGKSYEPYCPKWTEDLRRRIRAFFEYQCITCGKTTEENKEQLSCHHISYDKMICCNNRPVQFAALCCRCHARTNNDRERWEVILHYIINEIYGGKSYYTKDEWAALQQP